MKGRPPDPLRYVLRHVDGFLDFTDDEDAGKHLLQLFFWNWLGGVPDGAVGSDHGLWSQVEGIVATFRTLRTNERQKEQGMSSVSFISLATVKAAV